MENDIRLVFEKQDRARFISHLDLLRCMQRSFKRARVPIWYSQGYNPRSYIMFPLALSLGISSRCEIMDITLTEKMDCEELKSRMNAILPEGMKILHAAPPQKKHTEIGFAQYTAALLGKLSAGELHERFHTFLTQDKIEIEKLTKKKILTIVDIKPWIELLESTVNKSELVLRLRLPAGTQDNLNINVVFEAFEKQMNLELEKLCIERTEILCRNGEVFS